MPAHGPFEGRSRLRQRREEYLLQGVRALHFPHSPQGLPQTNDLPGSGGGAGILRYRYLQAHDLILVI